MNPRLKPSQSPGLEPGSRPSAFFRRSDLGFRPSKASSGFTLIEILIAIGIFSMVLAAIYSTWTSILRATKVGTEAAAAVQRARIAGRTIEESLGSVQSFSLNQNYYAFVAENGSEPTLSFVSRLSPSFPRSGKFAGLDVRRVTFSLERAAEGGKQLVLRQNALLMEMDKDEKNYPLVLAKNVRDFKTEFWDNRLQDWIDEWKQTNQLPVMVRVSFSIADNKYSSQVRQGVTRIVSLPSVTVLPIWESPRQQPGAGGVRNPATPGNPNNPGNPANPGSPGFTPSPIPGLPLGAGGPR